MTPSQVSLERQLRQLYLDLLGRPPTMAEYRFTQSKGAILEEDIKELMSRDEAYTRLKGYHRALLRSNISQSITTNGDQRLQVVTEGLRPLEIRGNPSRALRGRNGAGCDHFIEQDNCNAFQEDPHAEPAVKTCRDTLGVPMPVSFDYSTDNYTCTQLNTTNTAVTDCNVAVTQGAILDKQLYFCDMRRTGTMGVLAPFLCLPQSGNPITAALTEEVLDTNGRIIAFRNPMAPSGQLSRLDRCSLDLSLTGGVRGRYATQTGCVQKEGVVTTAAPFWDTAATVTMCAIEAQTRDVNPWTMESCETGRFLGDRSCGCGFSSRRCEPGSGALHNARIAAINEEPLQLIDSVLRRDENYFNVLTTRRSFVNGTLSQLYRQTQSPTVWATTSPTQPSLVPDVALNDTTTWAEYTRDEYASGVLTTASWLYRFPTQRSRVNQFWNTFLCKSFAPPAGAAVPAPEDSCNRDNNLATRCGCSYCHATIEPVGAHWGRFGERNATFLDPNVFPRVSAKCRDCALAGNTTCDNECGNYVMQAFDGEGAQSLGLLRTYLYRTEDEEPNIAGGPRLLVERMMQTGDLEKCAVKNAWNHLLGRPMTTEEEHLYMSKLVDQFAMSNHNFKHLMITIIQTDAYRRVD
ncbi:MAG: DUF1585 domain-containing protein [Archangium sp.]|nr:DUF1585 domain-containing protein [Archangium sp.]